MSLKIGNKYSSKFIRTSFTNVIVGGVLSADAEPDDVLLVDRSRNLKNIWVNIWVQSRLLLVNLSLHNSYIKLIKKLKWEVDFGRMLFTNR